MGVKCSPSKEEFSAWNPLQRLELGQKTHRFPLCVYDILPPDEKKLPLSKITRRVFFLCAQKKGFICPTSYRVSSLLGVPLLGHTKPFPASLIRYHLSYDCSPLLSPCCCCPITFLEANPGSAVFGTRCSFVWMYESNQLDCWASASCFRPWSRFHGSRLGVVDI